MLATASERDKRKLCFSTEREYNGKKKRRRERVKRTRVICESEHDRDVFDSWC